MPLTEPKSILITGASSGIGEALAMHYAQSGVTLFLGGRDALRLEAVASACRTAGAEAHTWVGDVTDEAGMRRWVEDSDDAAPLHLVIANAGIATGSLTVAGLHEAAKKSLEVNVGGIFNTVHPALDVMAKRQWPVNNAQIAVMASVMGYVGTARSPAYSTSKAAVKSYGQAIRGAVRHTGIGVTVICPGYVKSRMISGNTSSYPFVINADKSAKIIARALARNKARVTFPWQVRFLARIAINLPGFLVDRLNRPWGVPTLRVD